MHKSSPHGQGQAETPSNDLCRLLFVWNIGCVLLSVSALQRSPILSVASLSLAFMTENNIHLYRLCLRLKHLRDPILTSLQVACSDSHCNCKDVESTIKLTAFQTKCRKISNRWAWISCSHHGNKSRVMQRLHLSQSLPAPTLLSFPQSISFYSLMSQDKGLGVETSFPRDLETTGYTPVTLMLPKQTPDVIYKDKRFLLPLDLGVPVPSQLSALPLGLWWGSSSQRVCAPEWNCLLYSCSKEEREREKKLGSHNILQRHTSFTQRC